LKCPKENSNCSGELKFELTESFRNLRVVHFGIVLGDFAALQTRPDHEGVHGSLDVIREDTGEAAASAGTLAISGRHLLLHHAHGNSLLLLMVVMLLLLLVVVSHQ
jgi:hypothetical protein